MPQSPRLGAKMTIIKRRATGKSSATGRESRGADMMTDFEKRRYDYFESQYYALIRSNENWKRSYAKLADEHRRLRAEYDALRGKESL